MEITTKTTIRELVPEGYDVQDIQLITRRGQITYKDKIHIADACIQIELTKSKTPEQLANELGFKVGDKVWYTHSNKYVGKVIGFTILQDRLAIKLMDQSISNTYYDNQIINKVAVHCKSKEEYVFIMNLLKYQVIECTSLHIYPTPMYVYVNETTWESTHNTDNVKDYLILSVDEYCESQNLTPCRITSDGVKLWSKDWIMYVINFDGTYGGACSASANRLRQYTFSTEQAAKDYRTKQQPKELSKEEKSALYKERAYLSIEIENFNIQNKSYMLRITEIDKLLGL